MMTQLLEVTVTSRNLPIGEALGYGLPLSLFGFAVVFFVLALLWGILTLFKLFFYTIPNNKKKDASSASVKNSSVQKMEMTSSGAAAAVANRPLLTVRLLRLSQLQLKHSAPRAVLSAVFASYPLKRENKFLFGITER